MALSSIKSSFNNIISLTRIPFQFIIALFFIFHIFSISFGNIPKRGEISRKINSFTSTYLRASGNTQSWKMFITAPLVHSYNIRISLIDSIGLETTLPPLLPGFKETGKHFKEELFFIRASQKRKWYLEKYLKKACAEASRVSDKKFVKIKLVMEKDIVKKFPKNGSDKNLRYKNTFTYGETKCDL